MSVVMMLLAAVRVASIAPALQPFYSSICAHCSAAAAVNIRNNFRCSAWTSALPCFTWQPSGAAPQHAMRKKGALHSNNITTKILIRPPAPLQAQLPAVAEQAAGRGFAQVHDARWLKMLAPRQERQHQQ